ncbi:hypothetical protein [Lacinutrix salivirga]
MNLGNKNNYKKLGLSILLDAVGYISYVFPPFDFVWAPASAWIMTKLYKGRTGKIAAVVSFVEEALPFFDVIPTFTIMWFYTYVYKGKTSETIIEVD